jgi:YVTN family beta-propeller protein
MLLSSAFAACAEPVPLSPTAMVASSDGKTLYVACATAGRVLRFDTVSGRVSGKIAVPEAPTGLALSKDQKKLFLTCAAPESKVRVVDLEKMRVVETIPAGHTAMAPVISPDGKRLYVCNRFNNDVSVIDLTAKKQLCRVAVEREPVAAAITQDGRFLLVANHLHVGRADTVYVAASLSVIDTALNRTAKVIPLPNGSFSLADVRVSPDGRYAVVPHLVARFNRLPTHVTEGWINANALTVIDVKGMKIHGTMLLDDHYSGAANPWAASWAADGATLVVTHAGMHEVSVIDFQDLLAHLPSPPPGYDPVTAANRYANTKARYELPDDLPFFAGNRIRLKLPDGDLGPRAAVVVGRTAYVANYFSDTLTVIDISAKDSPAPHIKSLVLAPITKPNAVRKGELYFNDARLCYGGWQSCASCHPGEGRADGLNWDLLNDGVGNPKNTKSLLFAAKSAPLMSLGVRTNLEDAVRAGIEHILFSGKPNREVVDCIVAYVTSLKPVPSPYLIRGKLSRAALRGKKVFRKAGCSDCHVPGPYTDFCAHDVGTRTACDGPQDQFYTPSLIEAWRTSPYLHQGSAATVRDAIKCGVGNLHGQVSELSNSDLDALCAYVLSL